MGKIFLPSKTTSPVVAFKSLSKARPTVVLPLPLSPTSPTVLPLSTLKLTPSTALTSSTFRRNKPPNTGNQTRKSLTSRSAIAPQRVGLPIKIKNLFADGGISS